MASVKPLTIKERLDAVGLSETARVRFVIYALGGIGVEVDVIERDGVWVIVCDLRAWGCQREWSAAEWEAYCADADARQHLPEWGKRVR